MNEKYWYLRIDKDEESVFDGEVKSWMDGVFKILENIEKGIPFTCSLDFFYRRGE